MYSLHPPGDAPFFFLCLSDSHVSSTSCVSTHLLQLRLRQLNVACKLLRKLLLTRFALALGVRHLLHHRVRLLEHLIGSPQFLELVAV